jgi:hypothetical protein
LTWKGPEPVQSQQRIPVEHTIAGLKTWKQLADWTGPCDRPPETIAATAGFVSDITAQQ